MQRILVAMAFLAILSTVGCVVPGEQEKGHTLALKLVVRQQETVPHDEVTVASDVYAWMGPIAGGIAGSPPGPMIGAIVRPGGRFVISLEDIERALAAAAVASGSDPIRYEPAATRVARLGTFAEVLSQPDKQFFAVIEQERSRAGVFLIYVDRPCTLHGSSSASEHRITVHFDNVVLPRAGLHWLTYDDPAPGVRYARTLVPEGDLVYAVDSCPSERPTCPK